jgi:hypothetical protein
MFETKHMRINLGPRLWNLPSPSYGLSGRIEGTIRLSGDQDRIERAIMTVRIQDSLNPFNGLDLP